MVNLYDNIKGGIWREVIAGHEKAKRRGHDLGRKVTLDCNWHAGPNNQTLVAFGRKPSDRNPTGLQGFHSKHILVIVDECGGVPAELWDAAESLASNRANAGTCCVVAHQEPLQPGKVTGPRPSDAELAQMRESAAEGTLFLTVIGSLSDGGIALIDLRADPGVVATLDGALEQSHGE